MKSWLPDTGVSAAERHRLGWGMTDAVLDHLGRAAPARREALSVLFTGLAGPRPPWPQGSPGASSPLLHPDLFAWIFDLGGAAEGAALDAHLDALPAVAAEVAASRARGEAAAATLGQRWDTETPVAWYAATARELERAHEEETGERHEMVLAADATAEERERVATALALVAAAWPEMANEMAEWVQRLVVFTGPGVAGTNYRATGAVFVNRSTLFSSTLHLAEELVHEAAHVRLFAGFAAEPLIDLSDTTRYRTPLRPDLRPILGLLHQVFVLSRLVAFFDRARAHDPGAAEKYHRDAARLAQGYATLAEHARPTAAGKAMLAALGEAAQAAALVRA